MSEMRNKIQKLFEDNAKEMEAYERQYSDIPSRLTHNPIAYGAQEVRMFLQARLNLILNEDGKESDGD